jgi:hypothetical protein
MYISAISHAQASSCLFSRLLSISAKTYLSFIFVIYFSRSVSLYGEIIFSLNFAFQKPILWYSFPLRRRNMLSMIIPHSCTLLNTELLRSRRAPINARAEVDPNLSQCLREVCGAKATVTNGVVEPIAPVRNKRHGNSSE